MLNISPVPNKRYSYADYLTWQDDRRRELLDGRIFELMAAPLRQHQDISINLLRPIANYLDDKKCKIYSAPFDVRLPNKQKDGDKKTYTVVQPDLVVVCDLSKLDRRGCVGAPDLIVEITSPSTIHRDLQDKFKLYQKSGVREYWIVQPEDQSLTVFLLKKKRYKLVGIYASNSRVKVSIFEDLSIDLAQVFKT